ncbi:CoxG family protein [Leucobacter sp. USHLN153]|uniref:CoxG family protein n=1 Tax=Leucobacter sp. USHLN153 TaxID=3081268 RepID=UPI0030162B89
MIEVNEHIEVPGDPDATWALLKDPHTVAACVPGCKLVAQREDGSYDALVAAKFGTFRAQLRAVVWLTFDDATRTGSLKSMGAGQQSSTQLGADVAFRVTPNDAGGSAIDVTGQVTVTGKFAGIMQSGASIFIKRVTKRFAEKLTARVLSR